MFKITTSGRWVIQMSHRYISDCVIKHVKLTEYQVYELTTPDYPDSHSGSISCTMKFEATDLKSYHTLRISVYITRYTAYFITIMPRMWWSLPVVFNSCWKRWMEWSQRLNLSTGNQQIAAPTDFTLLTARHHLFTIFKKNKFPFKEINK